MNFVLDTSNVRVVSRAIDSRSALAPHQWVSCDDKVAELYTKIVCLLVSKRSLNQRAACYLVPTKGDSPYTTNMVEQPSQGERAEAYRTLHIAVS